MKKQMKWAGMTRLENSGSLWLGLKRAAGMGVQSGSQGRGSKCQNRYVLEGEFKKKKKTKAGRFPTHDAQVH